MSDKSIERHAGPITWGMFLVLVLVAIFIAAGFLATPLALLALLVAFVCTFRCTYPVFYIGVALTPFLGLIVSIPTGRLLLGERAFG